MIPWRNIPIIPFKTNIIDIIYAVPPKVVSLHFEVLCIPKAIEPQIMNRIFITSNITQLTIYILCDGLEIKKKYDIEYAKVRDSSVLIQNLIQSYAPFWGKCLFSQFKYSFW